MAEKSLHEGEQKAVGNLPSATSRVTGKKSYRFGKQERLRGRQSFSAILRTGKVLRHKQLVCCFITSSEIPPYTCMVGFAIRRTTNAQRNRVKRILREVYRTRKTNLIEFCEQKHIQVSTVFYLKKDAGELEFTELEESMREVLADLQRLLT